MKHFLRLLFIGSILFVLLGLFQQSQDNGDTGKLTASGFEQMAPGSGILTQHQDLPSPVSFSTDSPPPGFTLKTHLKSQEVLCSSQLKKELFRSQQIFKEIKPDLLLRTALCQYISSRIVIRS